MYQEASLMYGYDFTDKNVQLSPLLASIFDGGDTNWNAGELGFNSPYCGYPGYRPRAFGVLCGCWCEADEEEGQGGEDFGNNGPDYYLFGYTEEKEIEEMEAEA